MILIQFFQCVDSINHWGVSSFLLEATGLLFRDYGFIHFGFYLLNKLIFKENKMKRKLFSNGQGKPSKPTEKRPCTDTIMSVGLGV